MKKILLTGGSGFVGSNILKQLQIMGYVVDAPTRNELDVKKRDDVIKFVNKGNYDIIIHSASPCPERSPEKDNFQNLFSDMLYIFMNFYMVRNECEKIIYCGSGAEFDKTYDICQVKEEQIGEHVPIDSYGLGKYIMNMLARNSSNIYNLRLFACFGPREYDSKFITNAIRCCLDGKPITIRQDCYFDYLYIDDYIKFIKYFIEHEGKYHDYNACSGKRIMLSEIAAIVNKQMNNKQEILINVSGLNKEYTGSNSRILSECGMSEKDLIDIECGIAKLIEWESENYKHRMNE